MVVSHTRLCVSGGKKTKQKKTAPLFIQSSLSQSVKAAQITKTVIQLKLIRLKKQKTNGLATSTSWLPGTKTASSEGEKKTQSRLTDTPPPHFTFPRSFSDAIVPFRLTPAGVVNKTIPVATAWLSAASSSGMKWKKAQTLRQLSRVKKRKTPPWFLWSPCDHRELGKRGEFLFSC